MRRTNEALANAEIELFEIAKVYLPQDGELPREELMLGITSGRDYPAVKGVIEAILGELKIRRSAGGRRRRHRRRSIRPPPAACGLAAKCSATWAS